MSMYYCELCEELCNDDDNVCHEVGTKVVCEYCAAKIEEEDSEPLSGMYLVVCKNSMTHQRVEYDQVLAHTLQEAIDNGGMNVYTGRRRDEILFYKPRPTITAHDVTMGGLYGCD